MWGQRTHASRHAVSNHSVSKDYMLALRDQASDDKKKAGQVRTYEFLVGWAKERYTTLGSPNTTKLKCRSSWLQG